MKPRVNQPILRAAVEAVFDRACEANFEGVDHAGHGAVESGHGRGEERYVSVVYGPAHPFLERLSSVRLNIDNRQNLPV